jgi:hypothetical protein
MMPYSLKSLYLRVLHTSEDVYCVDVWQEDDEIYVKHNKRDGGDIVYCYGVSADGVLFSGVGHGSFYTKGWRDRYK